MLLNICSIWDSSPINSSKVSLSSKSLSMSSKNSWTSSLKHHNQQTMLCKMRNMNLYMDVGTPDWFRTWCHSSLVSFPSPFLSALLKYFRTSILLLNSAFSPPSPFINNLDIVSVLKKDQVWVSAETKLYHNCSETRGRPGPHTTIIHNKPLHHHHHPQPLFTTTLCKLILISDADLQQPPWLSILSGYWSNSSVDYIYFPQSSVAEADNGLKVWSWTDWHYLIRSQEGRVIQT